MNGAIAMSPVLKARIAGSFYLVTVVGSIYSFVIAPGTSLGHASGLVAGTANLVVTLLLYDLLRPVNQSMALLAVFFNIEVPHTITIRSPSLAVSASAPAI